MMMMIMGSAPSLKRFVTVAFETALTWELRGGLDRMWAFLSAQISFWNELSLQHYSHDAHLPRDDGDDYLSDTDFDDENDDDLPLYSNDAH